MRFSREPATAADGAPHPPASGARSGGAGATAGSGRGWQADRRLAHGDSIRLGGTTLNVELPVGARQDTDLAPTLVVTEGPRTGERFPVATELTLGRENADIVLDDGEVSRRHAVVRRVDGALEISDASSANGTFVNDARIDGTRRLADGDVVRLGKTSLKVEAPQGSRATTVSPGSTRTVVTPPPR